MKKQQKNFSAPAAIKPKESEREFELQAINRILERRHDVLVMMG